VLAGEVQIKSRQVWESGLRWGEIGGKTCWQATAAMATKGRFEGICAMPTWKVAHEGPPEFRASAIEPWQFRIEVMQQSGSGEEF